MTLSVSDCQTQWQVCTCSTGWFMHCGMKGSHANAFTHTRAQCTQDICTCTVQVLFDDPLSSTQQIRGKKAGHCSSTQYATHRRNWEGKIGFILCAQIGKPAKGIHHSTPLCLTSTERGLPVACTALDRQHREQMKEQDYKSVWWHGRQMSPSWGIWPRVNRQNVHA